MQDLKERTVILSLRDVQARYDRVSSEDDDGARPRTGSSIERLKCPMMDFFQDRKKSLIKKF